MANFSCNLKSVMKKKNVKNSSYKEKTFFFFLNLILSVKDVLLIQLYKHVRRALILILKYNTKT